jgi:ankyrin repeat protein
LQDDLVGNDIAHFVSHRLKLAIPENKNAALVNSLLSTICTRSQGLFLYARLLLDQITPILQSEKQVNIEALVKSLPVGLEDMYNSMLFQQSETLKIETAIQVFLLACATHSSRSLRLNELANFLQFRFTRSMAPGTPKAVARAACAPLLEIMEDETVQVIHHSFTEFLLDSERTTRPAQTARQFPILEPQNVHRMLAVACLDYLQSGVLEAAGQLPRRGKACYGNNEDVECDCEKKEGSDKATTKHPKYDYQQARLQYPFLEYGVQNWSFHAGNYDVKDESFFASIKSFAETDSGFRRWLSIVKTDKFLHPIAETPSLLHVAAFAGLAKFANHLLQAGQPVDPRDIEGKTPLLWASSSGHTEMVSILLKHGAVPDAEDECGVKPIHLAARQNYHGIVKMLLEAGVDPITPKTKDDLFHGAFGPGRSQERTKGDTAVQYICRHGHTETILVMLPFLQPETLEEVLCETCRYGKFESARAVLENSDVSVNSQFTGATALHLACIAPNVDCVQMLLEKGADIKLISESKPLPRYFRNGYVYHSPGSALQGLIRTWNDHNHPACVQIFQLLMRAGADLKEKDSLGETPLLSQFQKNGNRSIPAVKTLLAAGASTSDVYQYGDTILHRYLDSNMDIEMLDLLLEHGADVTARGRLGETVLHSLLKLNPAHYRHKYSKKDVIEYFLAKGAQPQVKNESGKSALEAAMLSPTTNLEIFKLLLRYCPDESIRKQCLWLIGSKRGKEQVQFIRELQAASMSLDARTSGGQTVLLSTIRLGDTWKALVECGASLDAIDSRGWGALHHFISSTSSIDQLQELINAGLDPHMADNEGRTLLHIIALHYEGKDREVKLIEFLLSLGLSVNAMTRLGRTPLHLHIEGVPNQVERCSGNEKLRVSLLSIFQKSGYMLDVNIQDNEGLSALHLSAMRSEFDVARLLDAGADFTLVTKAKRSALHLACRARRSGVVGLLLDKVRYIFLFFPLVYLNNRTCLHQPCLVNLYRHLIEVNWPGWPPTIFFSLDALLNLPSIQIILRQSTDLL